MSKNAIRRPPLSEIKGENEPLLDDAALYNGMYIQARKMLMAAGRDPAEVALMTDKAAMDELQRDYAVVAAEEEKILLVPRARLAEFNALVKFLSR